MRVHPRWRVSELNGEPIILPDPPLRCPFCGAEMLPHQFGVAYQVTKGFYHADVNMKCPGCCFYVIFGIPIDSDAYEILRRSKLAGKVLTDELLGLVEGEKRERLRERLEALGYW